MAGYTVYQGHDNRGLLLYARFGSATGAGITNSYDNVGRLASSSTNMDGTSRTFTATYDADGNRTQLSGDAGYVAKFDYDGLDRISVARDSVGTSLASFTYDQLGRRSLLGQGYNATTSTSAYAYDDQTGKEIPLRPLPTPPESERATRKKPRLEPEESC